MKADLAIMHTGFGIKGDTDPGGKARTPRHGIFTWAFTKENNHGLIMAVHIVNIRETVLL